ncbi:MAG: AAA family ATPase [bacterium]
MLKKIGLVKNTEIVIDESFVKEVSGKEMGFEFLDKILGFLVCVLGYIVLFVMIDGFLSHSISKSSLNIFLSVAIVLFIYSVYLFRSHDSFSFGMIRKNLNNVSILISNSTLKQLNISPYISNGLLNELGRSSDIFELFTHLTNHFDIREILLRLNLDKNEIKDIKDSSLEIKMSLDEILLKALEISIYMERDHIDSVSVYIALLENVFNSPLEKYGLNQKYINALKLWLQNTGRLQRYREIYLRKRSFKPTTTINRALTSRYSPNLINYSTDLTVTAIKGNVMFSLARDKEINAVIENLSRSNKTAVLLLGEPGIGKSTLIKSIGIRMVIEQVPKEIRDMRLVSFNFSKAFALSKGLDDYKSIIQNSLEEAGKAKNIILVIDDFDQFINVRADFVSEIVGLFVKAYEEFNLKVIATSNREGFSRYISSQKALASMFSVVELTEPSEEVSIQVLLDKTLSLEKKYSLQISFDALVSAVKFGSRVMYERTMPEKGIFILEKACLKANAEKHKELTSEFVEKVISEQIGVRVGKLSVEESKELDDLEATISAKILGQKEAVMGVVNAIKRSRAELTSNKKPLASFLFYGPTGVGKTELAKTIADVFFSDSKRLIKIDLGEYQEDDNLARLIGKGDSSNFVGGELTEFVRKNPFSVVILDEIEKAKPRVLDLFLQLLDEGYLTDGAGRKVVFTNTIIVATSNVGSKIIADSIASGETYKQTAKRVEAELPNVFKVEFLNRFDKLVMFKPLLRIDIEEIANLILKEQIKNLKDKGIDLIYSKQFLSEISDLGYDPVYGARSMRRAVQDNVESKIAELIVSGKLKAGGSVEFKSLKDVTLT